MASFVIIFLLGFGLISYLQSSLDHQIEDMQVHNDMMMMGSFDSMGQQGMAGESGGSQ